MWKSSSDTVENNHRRRARQRLTRNPQRSLRPHIDLEPLADPAHEFIERGHETMHRQHDGGAQPPGDFRNAVERHGVGAVDRHHHDVEPADRRVMALAELVMEVPEMADAETCDLEDEDRVAVLDHLAVRIVAEIAPDVGRDVADQRIADAERYSCGLSVIAPAVQHMWDTRIRKQRVMRAV